MADFVVVEVGGVVCVDQGMNYHDVFGVVRGVEDAHLLHFVELHRDDTRDAVRCCFWDVDVDQECAGCR